DPQVTAFNEGQRNLALALFQRVMAHCPEQYLKMAAEASEQE
ncbi:Bbp19 family protein, partial [Klebsiella pneumoniae]